MTEESKVDWGSGTRRRVLAEQYDLALAWGAATFGGALFISLAPANWSVRRMVAPLGVMGLYLTFTLTRSRFSTIRVADSVYFMGFLWTLWAVIDVLIFSKQQLSAERLYEAFGSALFATAAGMFIRLALLQFYRTVDDQEEQAVDRIDERVERLIRELDKSQQAVDAFRTTAVGAMVEWGSETSKALNAAVEKIRDATEAVVAEEAELAASIKQIREPVGATVRAVELLAKKLTASTEKFAATLEAKAVDIERALIALTEKVDSVELRPDILEGKLREVVDAVDKTLSPIKETAITTLGELQNRISEVSKAIIQIPENEDVKLGLRTLSEGLKSTALGCNNLAQTSTTLAESLTAVRDSASTLDAATKAVKARVEALEADINRVHAEVTTVGHTLREVVGFVQSNLRK